MDEKDNINPALNPEDQQRNELSAEEFQRRLYAWFEDRGLLSDLRAHMRMQMINALKDSALGTIGQTKQSISPKIQAINLLIAEFLLRQDCHYSLSVFSAEMPSINVLPELPSCVANKYPTESSAQWRFAENDMWDILETLGVARNSDEGTEIVNRYYDSSNEDSLLTCLMRLMHKTLKGRDSGIDNRPSCSSLGDVNKFISNTVTVINGNATDDLMFSDLIDILTHCGTHSAIIQQIVERVRAILKTERERIAKEERETYLRLEAKLNEEAARQNEEHNTRMENINTAIEAERETLREEQRSKQAQLESYSNSIHKQSLALRKHFDEILVRDQALRRKESEFLRRERVLRDQEKQLHKDMTSLCSDQLELLKQKINLEAKKPEKGESSPEKKEDEETREGAEAASTSAAAEEKSKDSADNCQQTSEQRKDMEDALLKGMVRQLQLENAHLRTLNAENVTRIQELNQRANALFNELESINGSRSVFRNHRSTTNAPLVMIPAPRHRNTPASAYGGGEEGVRIPTATPRPFRNVNNNNREARKRVSSGRLSLNSSTSEDASSTDAVLQETRERLRRLEQESDEIDRNFRRFRERQAAEERLSEAARDPFNSFINLDNYPNLFGKESTKQSKQDRLNRTAESLRIPESEMPSTSRGLGSFDPATVQLRTYSLIEVGSLINEASTSAGNPVHDRGFFVHDETRAELDREENAEGNLREGNTSMSRQSTAASSVAVNENMSGLSNLQIDTGETSESSSNVDLESKKDQH